MEVITKLPPGTVTAKIVLAKDDYRVELLRVKYGSRTRFVERTVRTGRTGVETVLSFRQTDEYVQDSLANEWLQKFVELKINNEQYSQTEWSE